MHPDPPSLVSRVPAGERTAPVLVTDCGRGPAQAFGAEVSALRWSRTSQRGDRLVVSELSRLGRSLGQIVTILDALAKAGVAFVALKENIRVDGERDIQTKVMTTLFALFAEVERDLISERTREGLARAARQLYEIGWLSVPLIAAAGFAVGIVLSMHTRASLQRFGAEALIPAALTLALVRETGPLVVGLLVSGRVGAGVGAELGAMKVTEQVDALEASAVDSFKFLVVTRMVACVVAMPILTTVMNFTGIVGGWVAETAISGMGFRTYFQAAFSIVEFTDYLPGTLKTMVFGFIIAMTASYLGLNTSHGTQGVGRAATRSVVLSSMLLIAANVVLVRLIFFVFPETAE